VKAGRVYDGEICVMVRRMMMCCRDVAVMTTGDVIGFDVPFGLKQVSVPPPVVLST